MNEHFRTRIIVALLALLVLGAPRASAQTGPQFAALEAAFKGARVVDLRTSQIPTAVTLRTVVKIPPPAEPVLVKMFTRDQLPPVLRPVFSKPGVAGVTIRGKYIAIIHTELVKEYQDTLGHEIVHAYISLVSPEPLPFWFQEGSAVHFSMGKAKKFYGQPSRDAIGVMVGRVVEVDPTYKQKLQSLNYMIDKAGKKRFYEWFRRSVETGVVEPSALLGPSSSSPSPRREFRKPIPIWLWAVAGAVVIAIIAAGIYTSRRDSGYY